MDIIKLQTNDGNGLGFYDGRVLGAPLGVFDITYGYFEGCVDGYSMVISSVKQYHNSSGHP